MSKKGRNFWRLKVKSFKVLLLHYWQWKDKATNSARLAFLQLVYHKKNRLSNESRFFYISFLIAFLSYQKNRHKTKGKALIITARGTAVAPAFQAWVGGNSIALAGVFIHSVYCLLRLLLSVYQWLRVLQKLPMKLSNYVRHQNRNILLQ